MARIGPWPPVIVVAQSFDATVARTLLQMRVADFMVKPVSPVDLVRTCANVAKSATAGSDATESENSVRNAFDGPGRQVVDLSGRPRFPARRLRRLSRPRAAAQSR